MTSRRPISGDRRLLYDRAALMRKIARYDRDLRNVHWIFLAGLVVMLLGVFIIWLVVADVTLYTIGRIRYVADPVSYGLVGAFFAAGGFVCLGGSIYVRIRYPSKLENLRRSLHELEDLLVYRGVFPPDFRKVLGEKYHVHYEDYAKELRRVESLESTRSFLGSYGYSLCFLAAGLFALIKGFWDGYPCEATTIGGLFMLPAILWILWKHRKNRHS